MKWDPANFELCLLMISVTRSSRMAETLGITALIADYFSWVKERGPWSFRGSYFYMEIN